MDSTLHALAVALVCSGSTLAAPQADPIPPKVVSLQPAHETFDVDAQSTTELIVRFDVAMRTGSHSFCRAGGNFPEVTEAVWRDSQTCVLTVKLAADTDYTLSLNCPGAQGLQSAKGVALVAQPWRFSTRPAELLSRDEQRARNRTANRELAETLATHYSYYDDRDVDWDRLFREHGPTLENCQFDAEWARRAGAMLEVAGDLHLSLRDDKKRFIATKRRSVDSLFRRAHVVKRFGDLQTLGDQAMSGRHEGVAYLAIGSWTQSVDLAAIEKQLAAWAGDESVRGLILDVRPNSGGDELKAQRIAEWFVNGTKIYAKNVYRTGPGTDGFGPVLDRVITGNRSEQRLTVPVCVLIGPAVMSSCEAFVLMMKQAENTTTIGRPSWGSSGNPRPFTLSNGVVVNVPSWRALRPDGTCFEGEGIAPDVSVDVDTTDWQRQDPILTAAWERLQNR